MANIFLDTNFFVDLFESDKSTISNLSENQVFVSPLSYHICAYIKKMPVPNTPLINSLATISTVSLSETVLSRALLGPTKDLEDNLQLQSAVESNSSIFLTHDKELLRLGYFGKVKISDHL